MPDTSTTATPDTSTGTSSDSGGDNSELIGGIVAAVTALGSMAISTASKETTDCGKNCRAKCKAEHGWLFAGRRKCKKRCKADCLNYGNAKEPDQKKAQIWGWVIVSLAIIISTLLVIWYLKSRK